MNPTELIEITTLLEKIRLLGITILLVEHTCS